MGQIEKLDYEFYVNELEFLTKDEATAVLSGTTVNPKSFDFEIEFGSVAKIREQISAKFGKKTKIPIQQILEWGEGLQIPFPQGLRKAISRAQKRSSKKKETNLKVSQLSDEVRTLEAENSTLRRKSSDRGKHFIETRANVMDRAPAAV